MLSVLKSRTAVASLVVGLAAVGVLVAFIRAPAPAARSVPQVKSNAAELPAHIGVLPDVSVSAEPTTRQEAELTGRAWYVTALKDPVRGNYAAAVERRSLDSLSFDAPYDGEQRASIAVLLQDGRPADLFVSVDRGQFVCTGADRDRTCSLRVSIDGAPARLVRFSMRRHSESTSVHLVGGDDGRRLLASLTKAKRLRIHPVFQQGRSPEIDFALTGLAPAISRIMKHSVATTPESRLASAAG